MRRDLSLRLWLSAAVLAAISAACEVRLQDPGEENEREEYVESWSSGPGSGTYSFVKCSSKDASKNQSPYSVCGTRLGLDEGPSYNWQTNCNGSSCGSVSIFAHYMLTENLGPRQTLRIEAFQNPQFSGSPASSLEIQGFDASKPTSSSLEEIFLAPGEYYFRAFLSPVGEAPVPYSLQGMELVSETPVGVLGALSGAQRVLVKSSSSKAETVHIYIDQLFKKNVPEAETFAKFRLDIQLDETLVSKVEKHRDVHILLLKEPDLELKPLYDFPLSTTTVLAEPESSLFVSPSLSPSAYYVFVYIDANSNRYFDEGEIGSYVANEEGKAELVTIEKDRTKSLKISLKE